MNIEHNPSAQDPGIYNELTSAYRIGRRIREIRLSKGMTQAALGEKVGLTADRIQKYENGARKPKLDLLKQIADALGVETLALTDPVVGDALGAIYALFEMESLYGLQIGRDGDTIILTFAGEKSETIRYYLTEWEQKYISKETELKDAAEKEQVSILKEYDLWKWTFPKSINSNLDLDMLRLRRRQLQEKILHLSNELADIDQMIAQNSTENPASE